MSECGQFVKTFLQLIALSSDVPTEQFYQTSDYHKLQSLGPSLPTLKLNFPKQNESTEVTHADLTFKSIKPPFKFTHQFSLPQSTTIYKVKTNLIEQLDVLKSAGVTEDNIKLLVKSKVVQDTTTIASLGDEVSFSVMVTAPKVVQTTVDDEPEVAEPIIIAPSTWERIHQVLKQDLDEARAKEVLSKLQTAWDAN